MDNQNKVIVSQKEFSFILGLDWDGTVSDYTDAFAKLATLCSEVVIITLNGNLTIDIVAETLKISRDQVTVVMCPYSRARDFYDWKAEQCRIYDVTVMFDDDHRVIDRCLKAGISAIGVREDNDRFTRKPFSSTNA